MTYKWVECNTYHPRWYFIEYNSPEDFVGWSNIWNGDKKLQMYTSSFSSIFKAALRWRLGDIKITNSYPQNLKRDQWAKFLTGDRRNFPRQMIQDVFSQ